MKKISLLFALVFLIANYSCERDDICPESTPTTPRLIIDLYDLGDQETQKNVFDLRIQGVGNDNALPGFDVASSANSIILPLRTDASSTQYKLHIDYAINDNGTPDNPDDDFAEGNEDIITISYTTEEIYVSRACGYKTIFKNVSILLDTDDTDPWILLREAINDNQSVEDETTTHFNIFH
jgi:hypothetical protein